MTVQEGYKNLLSRLLTIYETQEAANISDLVIEFITGWSKMDRLLRKNELLNSDQQEILTEYTGQLLQHRPVQYVLGETWFGGFPFWVDENVLIPRPETEELVQWVIEEIKERKKDILTAPGRLSKSVTGLPGTATGVSGDLQILDVGTGSGCISVTLKKKLPGIDITSLDVNALALKVAEKNAIRQNVDINFLLVDFLKEEKWDTLPVFDIIISNPPYITESESSLMDKNVLDFEPHLALFVPDGDALLFYRKLAGFSRQHLSSAGSLFAEINEKMGHEVTTLFMNEGFRVDLKKDMQGKNRMLRVVK
jgi:release factor glutamine methyltransferase